MRPGSMKKRITFQRRTGPEDDFGTEDQKPWVAVFRPVWARVAMQNGREFERARMLMVDVEQLFITRWCTELSTITEKDRISYNGKLYDIRSINHVGEGRKELQFLCTHHG